MHDHPTDKQFRAWCIDYSLRMSRATLPTAEDIIADAKTYQNYIDNKKPARVLKLAKNSQK